MAYYIEEPSRTFSEYLLSSRLYLGKLYSCQCESANAAGQIRPR